MSDEWLTVPQTAERLGCSQELVHVMVRRGFLPSEKPDDPWLVKAAKVEELRAEMSSAPATPTPVLQPKVEPGMVEVTIALASIAAGVAAFLPNPIDLPDPLKQIGPFLTGTVATLAGIVAALSAYGALWLLARHCLEGKSDTGLSEIKELLSSRQRVGPHWIVALSLLVWLVLSVLVGALAVMR